MFWSFLLLSSKLSCPLFPQDIAVQHAVQPTKSKWVLTPLKPHLSSHRLCIRYLSLSRLNTTFTFQLLSHSGPFPYCFLYTRENAILKAELQSLGCIGGKQPLDYINTPHFSKVHSMPLHFYERSMLVPTL